MAWSDVVAGIAGGLEGLQGGLYREEDRRERVTVREQQERMAKSKEAVEQAIAIIAAAAQEKRAKATVDAATVGAKGRTDAAGITGQTARDVEASRGQTARDVATTQGTTARDVANTTGQYGLKSAQERTRGVLGAAGIGANATLLRGTAADQTARDVANIYEGGRGTRFNIKTPIDAAVETYKGAMAAWEKQPRTRRGPAPSIGDFLPTFQDLMPKEPDPTASPLTPYLGGAPTSFMGPTSGPVFAPSYGRAGLFSEAPAAPAPSINTAAPSPGPLQPPAGVKPVGPTTAAPAAPRDPQVELAELMRAPTANLSPAARRALALRIRTLNEQVKQSLLR